MNSTSLLFLSLIPSLLNARFHTLYKLDANRVQEDASTNVLTENQALGSCTCDITLGSCDAYCCCDQECSASIRAFWNSNYNSYCLNYLGETYKPFSQCLELTHVFNYRERKGMEITETNNQLCVELDTGSLFSDYQSFVGSLPSNHTTTYNISQTLFNILPTTYATA